MLSILEVGVVGEGNEDSLKFEDSLNGDLELRGEEISSDDVSRVKIGELDCWLKLGGENASEFSLLRLRFDVSINKESFFFEVNMFSNLFIRLCL